MPVIEVQQLIRRFNGKTVLRGLDLTVNAGEFVALLGPNGAGKTTLVRILASLLHPSSGSIRVAGYHLPEQASQARLRTGVVLHQPLLYGDLTAEENLRFFARLYGIEKIEHTLQLAFDLAGLNSRRHDPIRTYSRGMQQRLSIARALMHDPQVLLLDEPYTGLDQDACLVLDELLRSVASSGRTILLSSHDLSRLHGLATRVDILSRGQIRASASLEHLPADHLLEFYRSALGGES